MRIRVLSKVARSLFAALPSTTLLKDEDRNSTIGRKGFSLQSPTLLTPRKHSRSTSDSLSPSRQRCVKPLKSNQVLCSETYLELTFIGSYDADEMDSYMYQTVGNSGISSIAKALRLPLFTHHIEGSPIHIEGEYGTRQGKVSGGGEVADGEGMGEKDETEDLHELLSKVKVRFVPSSCRVALRGDFRRRELTQWSNRRKSQISKLLPLGQFYRIIRESESSMCEVIVFHLLDAQLTELSFADVLVLD